MPITIEVESLVFRYHMEEAFHNVSFMGVTLMGSMVLIALLTGIQRFLFRSLPLAVVAAAGAAGHGRDSSSDQHEANGGKDA